MKNHKSQKIGNTLFTLLFAVILCACSTDTIDTWNDDTSLAWFATNDPFNFSFVTEPEQVTEVTQTIDIQLATPVKNQARSINLEVARQPQNPQTRIVFQNPVTVSAGASEAKFQVTFYRTPNLTSETDTLVLRIASSDDFQPGIIGLTEKTIVVSATYLQPQWWDSTASNTLGECNQLKLSIYYSVFGSLDNVFGESMWGPDAQVALFRLNDYAKTHYGKQFRYLLDTDKPL